MGNDTFKLELRNVSSLAKIFADEDLREQPHNGASALSNETAAFQVAYRANRLTKGMKVAARSDIDAAITLRSVGLVPSEMPVYQDHDEHVLRTTPGLYPDPLFELTPAAALNAVPGQWRSVWVSVEPGETVKPGRYEIRIGFESEEGEALGETAFELEILPESLPKQQLIHTEWFHTDCLATYYKVDVFSEKHWDVIENFVRTAVKHGINMILTPLFTPPLDTQVGGERPTVQLVDVTESASGTYAFGFEKLGRWVALCNRQGVEYFEFSHLFTQWGAKHAPKIMATVDGEYKRIFGWETDAGGEEYRSFIGQFLPALVSWIKENGLEARSYFHISDEPSIQHLESYEAASRMVREQLKDFPVIDALSDYDFYEKGLVKNPIPANDHIEPFLAHGVEPLWTYYCCGQYKQVANRFFSMPSARSRILGMQLYKFNIAGFLQWGYNFWYSQQSRQEIDPYRVTDAIHAFPSGDAFVVYPGEDGQPVESIRLEVFREALQDLRALRLLEERYGREFVIAGLEEGLDQPISFSVYPRDAAWLLAKREWVNAMLKESMASRA
jgi:Glycoside hydrolase 123, catalytic domain